MQLVAIHYPFLPLYATENISAAKCGSAPERPMFQKQMVHSEPFCVRGRASLQGLESPFTERVA